MGKIKTESSKLTSMRYDCAKFQTIASFLVVLLFAYIVTMTLFVGGEDTEVLKHPQDVQITGKEKDCLYASSKRSLILAYFAFGMSNLITGSFTPVGILAGSRCFAIWIVSNAFVVCNATFTVLWGTPTITYVVVIGCILTVEGTSLWIIGLGGFDMDKDEVDTCKSISTETLESSCNLQLGSST